MRNNIALLLLPYQTSLSNLCTKVGRTKWARSSFASLFFSFLPVVPHTYSQVTCISRLRLFATKLQKAKRRQVQLIGSCIPEGGGGVLRLMLGMCCWPLRAPIPLWSILWPTIDPILVTFGKCNFLDPYLVTFCLYIYLINVVSSWQNVMRSMQAYC